MKLFLIITLIAIIMIIASAISEQYKDKYDFYFNLKNFLNMYKLNVSFKKEKISNFLKSVSCKKHFKLFIDDYLNFLQTENLNLDNITLLNQQEKEELSEILQCLGKLNSENEIQQINSFLNIIQQKIDSSLEDKQKLCPLIIKLSLLFSVGLAIVLI